jgi:histidinol-phosphate aminotransferase
VDACLKNPKSLLIICSPNNPTGSILTENQIREILDKHKGFFLLDQAYVEFGGYSAIPLMKEYPNLIITKTLSKAFRGAGLRLGYMLGTPEIIKEINKIKLPYNINFFSEHVAIVALAHKKELEETLKLIQPQRQKLFDFLKILPLDKVYPSCANFICIRTEKKNSLFQFLKENGILIRDVSSYPMLENCLRISVGSVEENELVMQKLTQFFNEHKKE